MTFTINKTCDGCPLQYDGKIDDKFWYFRDRHGMWRFGVANTLETTTGAVGVAMGMVEGWRRTGVGNLTPEEAEKIIISCLNEYKEGSE